MNIDDPVSASGGRIVSAHQPTSTAAAAPAALFLALILLGIGVVALRDTALALQWLNGAPWIDTVFGGIDGLRFATWMIPAGLAAVALGLVLVIAAVRPRRKKALQVTAKSSVWISPWDLAGIATHAANSVSGVFDARTSATRRALTVSAHIADAMTADSKAADIDAAVRTATAIVSAPMKVTVRIQDGEAS